MTARVVGLGAGGHARVVIEAIRLSGAYEVVGLLDAKPELKGRSVLGVPVLGGDELLPELKAQGIGKVFIGLGSVDGGMGRARLYKLALADGLDIVTVVHPSAVVSPSARLGRGAILLARAVVNAGAAIGANVIINTGAIVEHDCVVGDHGHIATGACLASGVNVGIGAHIGAGASVKQSVTIGPGAVVGAGAAVVKDVPGDTVVVGVPARPLSERHRSGSSSSRLSGLR